MSFIGFDAVQRVLDCLMLHMDIVRAEKKITNIFLIIRDSAISTFLTRWKTINHEPQHTNSICYFFALVWWQSCGGCFCCYDNGHSQSRFMWSEMDWLLFFVRVFLVTNTVWDVRKSVESIGKHYHFHAMEPQNSIWGFRNGDSESSQAWWQLTTNLQQQTTANLCLLISWFTKYEWKCTDWLNEYFRPTIRWPPLASYSLAVLHGICLIVAIPAMMA